MTQTFSILRQAGMALIAMLTVGAIGLQAQNDGAPFPPTAFHAEFNGETSELHMSWDPAPDGPEADGYNIYASIEMNFPDDLVQIASTEETTYTTNLEDLADQLGLDPEMGLFRTIFFVTAYNENGESPFAGFGGDIDPRDGMDDEWIKFDIRLGELLSETLGPWMRPLTDSEKEDILNTLREEFGDLPFDPFQHGGEGHNNEDAEKILEAIKEIMDDVAGPDYDGDPCDLTQEQIDEINRRLAEEFGGPCPPMLMCGHDGGDFDPELFERFNERFQELMDEAMEDGEITREEAEEIERILREEFGDMFPIEIGWGGGNGGGNDDEFHNRLIELLQEAGGDDWNGDPCSLTDEQRAEIQSKMEEEFGVDLQGLFPCDHTGLDEAHRMLEELLMEAGGEGWNGDICSLTEEQRAEIHAKILDETGVDFDWLLNACDNNDGGGDHGDKELLEKLNRILDEIGGDDWDGNPCSLSDEQMAELKRRFSEELGVEVDVNFGCGDEETEGGNAEGEEGDALPTITTVKVGTTVKEVRSFPNPAVNSVNVEFNAQVAGPATVTLIDPAGNTVLRQNLNTVVGPNTTNLSLSAASSGTYFVRIELNGGVSQTIPVIVVR